MFVLRLGREHEALLGAGAVRRDLVLVTLERADVGPSWLRLDHDFLSADDRLDVVFRRVDRLGSGCGLLLSVIGLVSDEGVKFLRTDIDQAAQSACAAHHQGSVSVAAS